MRTGLSDVVSPKRGRLSRLDSRLKSGRKARFRRLDLEGLELRTLLATIPAPAATGAPVNLSGLTAADIGLEDADSPVVQINPYDSQEVVAVWVVDIPIVGESFVDGAYTTDGGANWSSLPSGISQTIPGDQATDPGVGFDSKGNVFVMDSQHAPVTPSGNPVPAAGA